MATNREHITAPMPETLEGCHELIIRLRDMNTVQRKRINQLSSQNTALRKGVNHVHKDSSTISLEHRPRKDK
jgi:hypothetical protein